MLRDRLPLLVTGIAGVAGYNAFHFLRERYPGQVVGIRPKATWRMSGPDIVAEDAEDPVGMRALFERFAFRGILNTIGSCALKSCELDPAMARRVNVESAAVVADLARRHGARLVHLSSDLVFSGFGHGHYVETDVVDPVTIYGKTMVQAEGVVQQLAPKAAILRISLPMGPSFNRHAGAIDWIQSRFRAGRPATLYFDEIRSSTYCADLSRVFEDFLGLDASGIYHLGGPVSLSLYKIAQIVNRVGDFDATLLKGCPRLEAGPMPPRAGNVTMNSDKLAALLGRTPFRPWPLERRLLPTNQEWHCERPLDEIRSPHEIVGRLYHPPIKLHIAGVT